MIDNIIGSLSVKQYCHWTMTSNDAFEELELIGMQKRKMQPVKNSHSMLAALKSKINQSGYSRVQRKSFLQLAILAS